MRVVDLPDDLAPSLRAAAEALLAEVPLSQHREHRTIKDFGSDPCPVCHKPGLLYGVDTPSGLLFVHRRCRAKVIG